MNPTVGNAGPPLPVSGLNLGRGRRRVTQQDLDMYQALVGGPPQRADARGATAEPATVNPPELEPEPAAQAAPTWQSNHRLFGRRLARDFAVQLADCCTALAARAGWGDLSDLGGWARRVSLGIGHKVLDSPARFLGSRFRRISRA